jgi:hypothetical protein
VTFHEQELKQIAGRAGRYNVFNSSKDRVAAADDDENDYTEPVIIPGEVLGMSKSDVAHIESCLKAADITVKQAGLCPTIELLKLLCIVALKNKHAPIVRGFFDEHERDQWSHAYDKTRSHDSIYASTVAHVHTRTVAGSMSVDTDIDVIVENEELGAALESKRSMLSRLKLGKQYRYVRVLSGELVLICSDNIVNEFGSLSNFLTKFDKYAWSLRDEKGMVTFKTFFFDATLTGVRAAHKFNHKRSSYPMSKLWTMFNDMSSIDPNSCFFRCDTSDNAVLAEVVDDIDGLSFEERFILSKAPANLDNTELMVRQRSIVQYPCLLLIDLFLDRVGFVVSLQLLRRIELCLGQKSSPREHSCRHHPTLF